MLYKTHLEIGENTLNTIEGRGRNLIDKKSDSGDAQYVKSIL